MVVSLMVYGERRLLYRFLVGKCEGKRPFEKTSGRWENNITMCLQEMGSGFMEWIDLAQNSDRCWALVNEVVNLRVT